ncbi:MAG: PTS fructose transporter subunit IIA [Burkholderiales bacterium]|jgi:PTS system mannose-specific IIA component|nr:PTS fructose transporter subunit IIA [Burkholderiales bacterium]MBP7518940.1 PTS fructose transporter subunit IIA [Leptothrix sp. (in: b-proteobacteria)]
MARLLLLAHAPLATALQAVARHAFPECADRLAALDVMPESHAEEIEALARQCILALSKGTDPETLVLTDVFGATPANVAQRLADGVRVRAVSGVNVPMLWRALNYCGLPLDELVTRSLAGGSQGVLAMASTRPQNQAFQVTPHDSQHHHHQQ